MRKIELLVPASSLEVLKIAVIFGADAVYIGGEAFGLRAKAKNFSHEDMKEGIAFAHEHGVKVYVTVNILAHNYDLPGVREYLTGCGILKYHLAAGLQHFFMLFEFLFVADIYIFIPDFSLSRLIYIHQTSGNCGLS